MITLVLYIGWVIATIVLAIRHVKHWDMLYWGASDLVKRHKISIRQRERALALAVLMSCIFFGICIYGELDMQKRGCDYSEMTSTYTPEACL